jgi:hypothetical protein
MPAIKAPYGLPSWTLFAALSLAPAVFSCEGDGEENHDASDSLDTPVEEAAEPELNDAAEDPELEDSPEDTTDVPDVEEEELPCPVFSEVQPLFTASCTGCHFGYDSYSTITSRLDEFRIRVEGFHHVFGDNRSTILRWIECGALP